jgi:tRNA uridine 5-carboxymethylaminomethyl modification enzyme
LDKLRFKRSDVEYSTLSQILNSDLGDSVTLSQIFQRQGINENIIYHLLPQNIKDQVKMSELNTALADSLYSGYIKKQDIANKRVNKHDNLKVPDTFNFNNVSGLSYEMIERIKRAKPQTFGQIRKISGLTPVALSTVLVHLSASKN